MKAHPSILGAAALALLLGSLANSAPAAEPKAPVSPVSVTFKNTDDFTDWELSNGPDWYRDSTFAALRSFLASQAEPLLPAGYHFEVAFTDIDLGHRATPNTPAVRAPEFRVSYRVTDASGAVVRQAADDLKFYVDFQNNRFSVPTADIATDYIQDEKPMLKAWVASSLAGLKSS
jgi:hypothetical protein